MQTGRLRRALLTSTLIFSCLGCRVTSERAIAGTYKAEAPCETITLVVNSDHTFVQSVHTSIGEVRRLSGRWSMDRRGGGLTFVPFLDFLNDGAGRQTRGAGFWPESLPRGLTMGPIIVKCPDSQHQIDYIK